MLFLNFFRKKDHSLNLKQKRKVNKFLLINIELYCFNVHLNFLLAYQLKRKRALDR